MLQQDWRWLARQKNQVPQIDRAVLLSSSSGISRAQRSGRRSRRRQAERTERAMLFGAKDNPRVQTRRGFCTAALSFGVLPWALRVHASDGVSSMPKEVAG